MFKLQLFQVTNLININSRSLKYLNGTVRLIRATSSQTSLTATHFVTWNKLIWKLNFDFKSRHLKVHIQLFPKSQFLSLEFKPAFFFFYFFQKVWTLYLRCSLHSPIQQAEAARLNLGLDSLFVQILNREWMTEGWTVRPSSRLQLNSSQVSFIYKLIKVDRNVCFVLILQID